MLSIFLHLDFLLFHVFLFRIAEVIDRNANKQDLADQITELVRKGNWRFRVGAIPKMSEAMARGAWRSDDSWGKLIESMDST